ncbi:hypothetical protein BN1195_00020 [Chryseobacterium oranimense G311]|uniref:hypothetical protein n=1 Tax=Chryseobacterium oranimense TaxID=421058 RepID=UPI0005337AF4|nr:hypothetical protein [Chryseobacterium oranimense]CEJ67744.1 hypothetical protein BN1195_00020 [Chryseobacterium oranimense G311]
MITFAEIFFNAEQISSETGNRFYTEAGFFLLEQDSFLSVNIFNLLFRNFFYSGFLPRREVRHFSQYAEAAKYAKDGLEAYSAQILKIQANPGFQYFSWAIIGTSVFLYPLNLGFYQIYRKIDLNEKLELGDLLAGYNGINFFKYIGYYIFWLFVYIYTFQTIILAVIWIFVTILVAPLMFFNNKRIFEAIPLNLQALRTYFLEIFVCVIVAVIFKYVGFALFFVGGLFTFPFWNAMIYSLYKTIFSEKS